MKRGHALTTRSRFSRHRTCGKGKNRGEEGFPFAIEQSDWFISVINPLNLNPNPKPNLKLLERSVSMMKVLKKKFKTDI